MALIAQDGESGMQRPHKRSIWNAVVLSAALALMGFRVNRSGPAVRGRGGAAFGRERPARGPRDGVPRGTVAGQDRGRAGEGG